MRASGEVRARELVVAAAAGAGVLPAIASLAALRLPSRLRSSHGSALERRAMTVSTVASPRAGPLLLAPIPVPLAGTREADAPDAVDLNDGRTNKYPITACRLGGNPSDYPRIHTDRS